MMIDLAVTFAKSLSSLDWMDTSSKKASLEKAKYMAALIGLPDFVHNKKALDELYEDLEIKKWDNYGNSQRLRAFKQAYSFAQMGRPRNRAQ